MPPPDDQQIEAELRRIVTGIDRWNDGSTNWGCGLTVASTVALDAVLRLGWYASVLELIGASVAGLFGFAIVFLVAAALSDGWRLKRAVRAFDRLFPPDTLDRTHALRVLSELQSTKRGVELLREKVRDGDGIVRRIRTAPEQQVQRALETPPEQQAQKPSEEGARIIPLEPFRPDDDEKR